MEVDAADAGAMGPSSEASAPSGAMPNASSVIRSIAASSWARSASSASKPRSTAASSFPREKRARTPETPSGLRSRIQ